MKYGTITSRRRRHFTSHIDTYLHYVLSTVSILYVYVLFFHVVTAFCQLLNERVCYMLCHARHP